MIEVPVNAKVECTDGPAGQSSHVIIDPTTRKVTHFVVTDDAAVAARNWLVPLEKVAATTHGSIQLNCTLAELAELEPFSELHYIQHEESAAGYPADSVYLAPYVSPLDLEYIPIESERIPPGELAVRRGATVEATDGYVGTLGEFLIDPKSGAITHFVLQEGHLWGKKEVTLPVSAIDRALESTIFLKIDKDGVNKMPAMPVKRHYDKVGERGGVELVARVFDSPEKASEAMEFLRQLQYIKIEHSAVLVKDDEGNVKVKETGDVDAKRGRIVGAITGGLIGLVGGPVGVVIGALAGAGAGGFAAKRIDMGLSDDFLNNFENSLKPGSSALVVLVEHQWVNQLSDSMSDIEGVTFQTTLSDQILEQILEEDETAAGELDNTEE